MVQVYNFMLYLWSLNVYILSNRLPSVFSCFKYVFKRAALFFYISIQPQNACNFLILKEVEAKYHNIVARSYYF